jgi:hypothetical protein
MSKSEANPNDEDRMVLDNAQPVLTDPTLFWSKPRRGFLFIANAYRDPFFFLFFGGAGTEEFTPAVSINTRLPITVSAANARRRKTKSVFREFAALYKQATPTGLGLTSRNSNCGGTAHSEIGPFGFRTCFEFRLSNFDFLSS